MTVYQLKKMLENCNPRAKICVRLDTFRSPIEEMNCIDVEDAENILINLVDGDGYTEYRKDGTEKLKNVVLLKGNVSEKDILLELTDKLNVPRE